MISSAGSVRPCAPVLLSGPIEKSRKEAEPQKNNIDGAGVVFIALLGVDNFLVVSSHLFQKNNTCFKSHHKHKKI